MTVNKNDTMHIAFCANDAYIPYLRVAVKGIVDNMRKDKKVLIHILTDKISQSREASVAELLEGHDNIHYVIHEVDDTPLKDLKVRHYTIYTWYRMLLPDLLPDVDKILYLDTDIAVDDDLSELADVDMTGKAVATPMDTDTFIDEPFARCGYEKEKQYVCVGVMIMNLDFWRRHDIARKVVEWGREHHDIIKYPDQDSINYVCRDYKMYIPLRFGVTKSLLDKKWFYAPEYRSQMIDAVNRPAIIHYAGCAPWYMESDHPMVDIWIKYNQRIKNPAKRRYSTKGIPGMKVRAWDILHPHVSRAAISLDEVRRRLNIDKKKRVLFFIESLNCGGAEKSLVSLLQLLDYTRVDVDLMLLRREGVFLDFVPKEVNIISFPAPKSQALNRLCQCAYALKWRALPIIGVHRHNAENRWSVMRHALPAFSGDYDVAVAYQQGFPTYFIAEKVKAPKKLAWVNIDLEGAKYRESYNRPFYDKYDYTVAVSEQLFDNLKDSKYFGKAKLTTVYDILNVDLIRNMAKSDEKLYTRDESNGTVLKLVTVGRLSRQKNYPLAIEAARILRDRGVNFEWIFVGGGEKETEIRALIEKYSLQEHVRPVGLQVNPYKFMAQADVYVHTALFEGYGLTIAEAKILGKPVVSTNFRIVYDQIDDGENGLVADMTPESVADKIMLLANDADLRDRIIHKVMSESNTTARTEVDKFYNLIDLKR